MKKRLKKISKRFALALCFAMFVGNIPVSASSQNKLMESASEKMLMEVHVKEENIAYAHASEEIIVSGLERIQLDKIEYTDSSTGSCQEFSHNWQVTETIQEQTCGKQGIWRIKCADCNVTATTFSDIYDHNYVDETCTNCGDTTIEIAPEGELNNWNYTLNETDKTITLTKYKGSSKDVIVYGRYKINGINYTAILNGQTKRAMSPFYSKRFSLKSITINPGVISYNCSGLFYGCIYLTTLDLKSFDTSKVTTMDRMFNGCLNLTSLNLSSFDTSKVNSMAWMFAGCRYLTSLDLSSFDTSKVNNMKSMFCACYNLSTIYVGKNWDTTSAITYNMFTYCRTNHVTLKE